MAGGHDEQAVLEELRQILKDTLQLKPTSRPLTPASPLLGGIPELDSMAVVAVITALEERFGFSVGDDEISAETFETLGSLAKFVLEKLRD
jgi:acyl carrier protein